MLIIIICHQLNPCLFPVFREFFYAVLGDINLHYYRYFYLKTSDSIVYNEKKRESANTNLKVNDLFAYKLHIMNILKKSTQYFV